MSWDRMRTGNKIGIISMFVLPLVVVGIVLLSRKPAPLEPTTVPMAFIGDLRRASPFALNYLNRRWILVDEERGRILDSRTGLETTIGHLLEQTKGRKCHRVGEFGNCVVVERGTYVFLVSKPGKIEAITSEEAYSRSAGAVFERLCSRKQEACPTQEPNPGAPGTRKRSEGDR